jgi:hypothetical protein
MELASKLPTSTMGLDQKKKKEKKSGENFVASSIAQTL